MTYPELFWAYQHTHRTHERAIIVGAVPSLEIFKICTSRHSKNALPDCLFLDFFVKHFPNYLSFHYEKLFFVHDFLKKLIYSNKKFVWL